jgi:hypothetical protein
VIPSVQVHAQRSLPRDRGGKRMHDMNQAPLAHDEIERALERLRREVGDWVMAQRTPGQTFGHFSLCRHSLVPSELNAGTGAIELWVMLGLPLEDRERLEAIDYIRSHQNRQTGLVSDSSWANRQLAQNKDQLLKGDTFFTMTAASTLKALGSHFRHPIAYLADLSPEQLIMSTKLIVGSHQPFSIGDYGTLIFTNRMLRVPNAESQWKAVGDQLERWQDATTGLWGNGPIRPPYTPYVNLAFHLLRTTWNVERRAYPYADRIVDTCLAAANDEAYYDWTRGFACNDLDLAVMLYSAAQWTDHRKEEVVRWARCRLPMLLRVQQADSGFSFYHTKAMTEHGGLRMSPGYSEGDMWGTLMYMGTIKMMVELGYPDIRVPWSFSQVHAVSALSDK